MLAAAGFELVDVDLPELELVDDALGADRAARGVGRAPRALRARGGRATAPGTRALLELGSRVDDDDVSRRPRRSRSGSRPAFARRVRARSTSSPGRRSRTRRRRRIRRSARRRATSRAATPAPYNLAGIPAVSLPCGIAEGNAARRAPARGRVRRGRAAAVGRARVYEEVAAMRIEDCNWMQLEAYLRGRRPASCCRSARSSSTRYLSLGVDRDPLRARLGGGRRAARRAVLPSLPYGLTPYFAAYPGSPTLQRRDLPRAAARPARLAARPGLPALPVRERPRRQRPRAATPSDAWAGEHADAQVALAQLVERRARACGGRRVDRPRRDARLLARELPVDAARRASSSRAERKPMADISRMRELDPRAVRELLGDGSLGGLYERPDEDVLRVWQAGVEEVRDADRARLGDVPELAGRVALVTGTAHGIGAAIADGARRGTARPCTASTATRSTSATREQVARARRAHRPGRHPRQQRRRRRRPGRPAARGGLRRGLARRRRREPDEHVRLHARGRARA